MGSRGFSVVEAVIAAAIVLTGVLSLAQLAVAGARASSVSAARSIAVLLAVDKLEDLRSRPTLASSPPNALDRDVDGFADWPPGWTRRWSVQPLPVGTGGAVVQVSVLGAYGEAVRLTTVQTHRVD